MCSLCVGVQVYDQLHVFGITCTELLSVSAEVYDVQVDISFPKGLDGELNFGTCRVLEESKLNLNLKNKGKFNIDYL